MRFEWTVGEADAGRRLDRYLSRRLGEAVGAVPGSLVQKLLRKGDVKRNGQRARPGDRVETGDVVVAHHSARKEAAAPSSPDAAVWEGPAIPLLHETADLAVVDKPAGVACNEGEGPAPGLLTWAADHWRDALAAGDARPAAVHRLDTSTTGCVCLGLTAAGQEAFRRALQEGRVRKLYRVLVWGRPLDEDFLLEIPLQRVAHGGRRAPKMVPARHGEGQVARTRLRWLAAGKDCSLLEAEPLTGRTHQIRAHCKAHGLPVVGDPRYGDRGRDGAAGLSLEGQLLHSQRLTLDDPAHGFDVEAPLPPAFAAALDRLGVRLPGA